MRCVVQKSRKGKGAQATCGKGCAGRREQAARRVGGERAAVSLLNKKGRERERGKKRRKGRFPHLSFSSLSLSLSLSLSSFSLSHSARQTDNRREREREREREEDAPRMPPRPRRYLVLGKVDRAAVNVDQVGELVEVRRGRRHRKGGGSDQQQRARRSHRCTEERGG